MALRRYCAQSIESTSVKLFGKEARTVSVTKTASLWKKMKGARGGQDRSLSAWLAELPQRWLCWKVRPKLPSTLASVLTAQETDAAVAL
jgi:hypothetical protein